MGTAVRARDAMRRGGSGKKGHLSVLKKAAQQ